jgi:hypothetical protein
MRSFCVMTTKKTRKLLPSELVRASSGRRRTLYGREGGRVIGSTAAEPARDELLGGTGKNGRCGFFTEQSRLAAYDE